jgi:SPP1 gp7 family putative phage head morphogenesis protein
VDKATVNQQLADSAVLQGISVGRIAKKVRGDVLSLLAKLRDELTAKLNSDAVMTDWQRQRAAELLKFSQATIDGAYQKIGTKTAKELEGLSNVEVQKLTTTVNAAVGVELSARMAPQQLEAIAKTDKLLVQGATQGYWWSKQSADLQHNFSTQIKMGLAQGKTIADMTKSTKEMLNTKYAGQAEALVRTAVATTQSAAQKKYFDANVDILKGIQFCATICRRTCLQCASLDGRAWTYPGLEPIGHAMKFPGWAPLHFGCRCTAVPVMRSWKELANVKVKDQDNAKVEELFQAKLKEKGFSEEKAAQIHTNQRASMDGQIAKTLNYEDWLKGKPTEFQQQVLGQQRWQLWYDGKAGLDQMIDGDGSPLSVAELQQAIKDNVAVPAKAAAEGQAGLSLGERNILAAMRTAAVQESAYKSAWLTGKGIVVDQAATHTLKAAEFVQLKKESGLVHLSNALAPAEFWDDSELRLWASLSGFRSAKLVMPSGKVAIVKLKIGQEWTSDDLKTYLRALRTAKQNPEKYSSTEAQVAYAFRATGKVTFATTLAGEVQTDSKLFKMIFPALAEQPALFKK